MRSGCCPYPAPSPDDTPGRHLIRSHHYKHATNDDGHHISAGIEREVPWVAIAPVVRSIRILERIVPEGELLFSAAHHDFQGVKAHHGALKNGTLNRRIDSFVAWANREAVAQVDAHTPADEPLLTALLAATVPTLASVFQRVVSRLGRTVPDDTQAARSRWQTDAPAPPTALPV
ncbi:hypothetical protein [Streptomyces canus]|uniref:hypothetical protein n=1 Tax=Streptomyces canus TaxID=58343 RepID=UPI002F917568